MVKLCKFVTYLEKPQQTTHSQHSKHLGHFEYRR